MILILKPALPGCRIAGGSTFGVMGYEMLTDRREVSREPSIKDGH
jgi:hypothetical protein